jgi:predicted RNase H-like nuclease (RuvC/YqgF family)
MTVTNKQAEKEESARASVAKMSSEIERLEDENANLRKSFEHMRDSRDATRTMLLDANALLLQTQSTLPNLAWQINRYMKKTGAGARYTVQFGEDQKGNIAF